MRVVRSAAVGSGVRAVPLGTGRVCLVCEAGSSVRAAGGGASSGGRGSLRPAPASSRDGSLGRESSLPAGLSHQTRVSWRAGLGPPPGSKLPDRCLFAIRVDFLEGGTVSPVRLGSRTQGAQIALYPSFPEEVFEMREWV